MIVADATDADVAAVTAIYGHHVLHGLGTFEERPPQDGETARRMAAVGALGLPFLVARDGGVVAGFAYAAAFRVRAGYRFAAEDSVYVAPDRLGRGVGKALLATVIARCEALGLRQMIAVIGDSANAASIGLHRGAGFADAGALPGAGFKFGRWVDVVLMIRPLGAGQTAAPGGPGLPL